MEIDAGANDASSPHVAFDANGNAFVVWSQDDGTDSSVYANRYDAGSGTWEGAVIIDAGADNAGEPRVAFDADGNAVAVWWQYYGTDFRVYANRYDAGSGTWEGAEAISAAASYPWWPRVAVDASGNAFVVWSQDDGTKSRAYANRYDADSGKWEGAEIIDAGAISAVPDSPLFLDVAVDASGNAFAVWHEVDGTNWSVYANRYDAGRGTWEGAKAIDSGSDYAYVPHVAFDASGNAFVVWMEFDLDSGYSIYSNRYDAASGTWEGAEEIDASASDAQFPHIAVDASGNAFAAWHQGDYPDHSIYVNRYDAQAGTWEESEEIDAGVNTAWGPQVAVNANGNAFVVWRQDDGTYDSVYANRYDAGTGTWEGAETIDAGADRVGSHNPQVAVDTSGNAFAVWNQYDGTEWNVYANRYQ